MKKKAGGPGAAPRAESGVSAKKAILTSMAVDVLDIFLNLAVALMTGSIVMVAETLQGISDFISVLFLYLGLKSSRLPPDKKHPFGYGKSIYIWALFSMLVMLVFASGMAIYMGIRRVLTPEPVGNIFLAYITLALAAGFNAYSFSVGRRRISGRKGLFYSLRRSSLVETKTTLVLDAVGVLTALIGFSALILYRVTGNARFDGLGAVSIGLALVLLTYVLIREVKELLIGKAASPEIDRKIRRAVLKVPSVREVLDLKTMYVGLDNVMVNIEVHLRDGLTTDRIEKIIDRIKEAIRKNVPKAGHIQVELETPDGENE